MESSSFSRCKIFYIVAIFLIILLVFAIPFYNWGFVMDDYGFIYKSTVGSLKDWIDLFRPHDVFHTFNQSNVARVNSFVGSRYRPIQFVYFAIQKFFFGLNPYCYFVFSIVLHAINSIFLYLLLLGISRPFLAFLGAMFFGLHPTMIRWLGFVLTQIYLFDLFILFLAFFSFFYYLKQRKIFWYITSCCLIFIQLLGKETLIVVPAWFFLLSLLYDYSGDKILKVASFKNAMIRASGYVLTIISYLLMRFLIFFAHGCVGSLNSKGGGWAGIQKVVNRLWECGYDILTCFFDFFYIGRLYLFGIYGYKYHKIIFLCMLLIFVVLPFVIKKQKMLLFFIISSIFIFMWPCILLSNQARYAYISLAFFIYLMVYAFEFYFQNSKLIEFVSYVFFIFLLVISILHIRCGLYKVEPVTQQINSQLIKLAKNPRIKDKVVCFVGLPMPWFAPGTAQALWLYGHDPHSDIVYDFANFTFRDKSIDPMTRVFLHDHAKHKMFIDNIKYGYMLTSYNNNKLYFKVNKNVASSLAQYFPQNINSQGFGGEVEIQFNVEFLAKKPVFVSWDYEKDEFIILGTIDEQGAHYA
jgi:hypothetical protein